MSLFVETTDVKMQTDTVEAYTVAKIVTKKLNTTLNTGDTIIITINGEDVINATIPANKQVVLNMNAQVKDV